LHLEREPHHEDHHAGVSAEEATALTSLRSYPFLKPLSEAILRKLRPNLVERYYHAGECVLRGGEYSDAAFYLKSGVVEVRLGLPAAAHAAPAAAGGNPPSAASLQMSGVAADGTIIVADMPVDLSANKSVLLEPGELFGELNALARYAVSSDVVARTNVVCLMIRTPALRMLFKQKEVFELIGGGIQEDIPLHVMIGEVSQRYHLFYIIPGGAQHGRDKTLHQFWKKHLGEAGVIHLDEAEDTSECIALTIGVNEGVISVAEGAAHLQKRGMVGRAIDRIGQALSSIVPGGPSAHSDRSRRL